MFLPVRGCARLEHCDRGAKPFRSAHAVRGAYSVSNWGAWGSFCVTFLCGSVQYPCDGTPPGSEPGLRAPATQFHSLEGQRWWSSTAPSFGSPLQAEATAPLFFSQIPSRHPPVRADTLAIRRLWTEWVSLLWSGVSESLSSPRSGLSRPEPVPGAESEAGARAGPVMWGGPWP